MVVLVLTGCQTIQKASQAANQWLDDPGNLVMAGNAVQWAAYEGATKAYKYEAANGDAVALKDKVAQAVVWADAVLAALDQGNLDKITIILDGIKNTFDPYLDGTIDLIKIYGTGTLENAKVNYLVKCLARGVREASMAYLASLQLTTKPL